METQMTHTGNKAMAVNEAWGAEGAAAKDMLIPRISLVQALSDLAKAGKAKEGDLVNSVTGEILGDKNKAVELIPIATYRDWTINFVNDKGQVINKGGRRVMMDASNENWAYDDVEDGKPIRRTYCINFFAMLTNKMDEFPFLISFRKSSLHAGKKLSSHFQTCSMKKVPPASFTFKLGVASKTWESHTFPIFTIEPSRATTPKELEVAKKWYMTLAKPGLEVADDGVKEDAIPF